jgi:hypothetical protein
MASEGVWFSIGPFGKETLKSIRSQLSRVVKAHPATAGRMRRRTSTKSRWITLVAVADGAVL